MTSNAEAGELEYFLQNLLTQMKRNYERGINKDLSRQYWMGLLQRNIKEAIHDGMRETLQYVKSNPALLNDKDNLIALWQQQLNLMLEHAIKYNGSSCAISNFADEHKPSAVYVASVKEDAQQLMTAFAAALDQLRIT